MPTKKLTGRLEARARELSPRGIEFRIGEDWLPVGEWVSVTHAQAQEIEFMGWPVTVREKEAAPEKVTKPDGE